LAVQTESSVYETDRIAGHGSFLCLGCGFQVALSALDRIPQCPTCGSSQFRRASLFEQPTMTESPQVESDPEEPNWLQALRLEGVDDELLAFKGDDGEVSTIPVPTGWTRIGRSITADIRLDDPTVSRRHALIVKTDEGDVRVLDDRSLNGLFVNGERVEWSPLRDGDELEIGRYRLHLVGTGIQRRPMNPAAFEA